MISELLLQVRFIFTLPLLLLLLCVASYVMILVMMEDGSGIGDVAILSRRMLLKVLSSRHEHAVDGIDAESDVDVLRILESLGVAGHGRLLAL